MATVVADMSMTLDGFVADPDDRVDHVFAWLQKGQHTVTPHGDKEAFRVDEASAEELRAGFDQVGALIAGRRLFDLAHGWGGQHRVSLVPVLLGRGIRYFDNLRNAPVLLSDHPRVVRRVGSPTCTSTS